MVVNFQGYKALDNKFLTIMAETTNLFMAMQTSYRTTNKKLPGCCSKLQWAHIAEAEKNTQLLQKHGEEKS